MPERFSKIQYNTSGIAVLSIPGNSASSATKLLETINSHIHGLSLKADIKGVILTDSENGFCLCSLEHCTSVNDAGKLSAFGQQVTFNIEKAGKPSIAVIETECSGLGLEIALSCDFIVASEAASFGFPGIADGWIPFCGGSQRLTRLVGKSKAKEMIFSGELIDAAEAFRIGLINHIYPIGEALATAKELLAHICTRSPNAIRIGGDIVNAGYDIDLQTACMLERDAFAICFASFDQREGMQAFLDKRQPQFKGK